MPLLPFRPQLVYQYVDARSKKKKDPETGKLTGGKIAAHREMELLSHAYTKAVEWGYIEHHPFKGEVRLEGESPRERYVEDWEVIEALSLEPKRKSGSVLMIQAYLRRSESDIRRLAALGATVRLCKGAYREPSALAFASRQEVDEHYARLMGRLLAPESLFRGTYPAFATHDERMHALAVRHGAPLETFELQMLYGIGDDLSARLRAGGIRLRRLVPFGEDWYGYFMRRLAERPANLVFLLRNLAR